MKLSVRIIAVVIAVLVILSVSLATISVGELRRASERHLEAYLALGLDQYLRQYPQRLAELLDQHGLGGIDSFVEAYQTEAVEAAAESELRMGARIGVVVLAGGEFLESGASISAHVEEHMRTGELDTGRIHFDADAGEYYVYDAFEPWGWVVIAAAPDDAVRDEIRSVLLRITMITAAVSILAALLLSLWLRRSFIAPVLRIASAARTLPAARAVRLEESFRADELGQLARDIVAAGETIRESQQELSTTNQDLERTVGERTAALNQALARQKTLVREVHHRVKNNMNVVHALLEFQKRSAPASRVEDLLTDVQRRIAAMNLIHEQLYRRDGGDTHLDSREYLGEVVEQLRRSFPIGDSSVEIEASIDSVAISTETAMPCGLITNELVTNALKYAFVGRSSGQVTVRFGMAGEGMLRLAVSDNGVGLSDDSLSHIPKTEGIGTELVAALCSQLHGTISRSSNPGVTVEVTFPIPE